MRAWVWGLGLAFIVSSSPLADELRRRPPERLLLAFDSTSTGFASRANLQLNVYRSGFVSVSFANAGTAGALERSDFAHVGRDVIDQLGLALRRAGITRLSGPLEGFGVIFTVARMSRMTFIDRVPTRHARTPTPDPDRRRHRKARVVSFSYRLDVIDERAKAVDRLVDEFIDTHFPELFDLGEPRGPAP